MMTEELAGLMGVVQPEVEKRQCVTKVVAAGLLQGQTGKIPSLEEVEALGQQLRLEQARQASEAEALMGHPEPKVTAVEHELRMYAHDVLKAHHDKDFRSLAVYPLEQMANMKGLACGLQGRCFARGCPGNPVARRPAGHLCAGVERSYDIAQPTICPDGPSIGAGHFSLHYTYVGVSLLLAPTPRPATDCPWGAGLPTLQTAQTSGPNGHPVLGQEDVMFGRCC